MHKKSTIISTLSVLFISIVLGYSLVFSGVSAFNATKLSFQLSNNIYPDSAELNKVQYAFRSGKNLENHTFTSSCDIRSKLLRKGDDVFLFEVTFLDSKCSGNRVSFKDENGETIHIDKLNILSKKDIYNKLLDIKTADLEVVQSRINTQFQKYSVYKNYNESYRQDPKSYLKNKRTLDEVTYMKGIIDHILVKRSEKYTVPVPGNNLSTNPSRIPNAGRPYRADVTDGIHHGWDMYGDLGEKTVAIDDAIVIRVVTGFEFSELYKIRNTATVTEEDKRRNLDIYRGNQVWLKTMKGEIMIYSHLSDVYSNIKEGVFVNAGDPVGTIGVSGIPEKNYNDYHLHFAIHTNPYNTKRAGKYDIDDYMAWDWYYKGKSKEYVLENQGSIFKAN